MSMFQCPDQPGSSQSDGRRRILDVKHCSLLEQIESLVSNPYTEHSRLAAMLSLDGVREESATTVLNRVRAMHPSKSLECQCAEMALEGRGLCSEESMRTQLGHPELILRAVPSVDVLRERMDWNPGWYATTRDQIVLNQTPQGAAALAWLSSIPKYSLLSEEDQRRAATLLSSSESVNVCHPPTPVGAEERVGGGCSSNFRVAKEAAFVLGGPLLLETQEALLRQVDFSPSKRHGRLIRSQQEHEEWRKQPEARPSVAWACCHALHDTYMEEMEYSRFLSKIKQAAFSLSPDRKSLVIPDEVLAAAFILNGQLHEAWRQWMG